MNNYNALASWSGGKDSCLACYKAMQQGYKIKYLLNFISKEFKRCCFHGIGSELIKLQAQAIGIPLIQKEVTADMQAYEKEFKEAVLEIKTKGINTMIFGDIYLLDHESWVERVCRDIGIKALEPLWQKPPLEIIREFIDAGFKTIIVSAQAEKLGEEFIGQYIDHNLVDRLLSKNVCPCGENGEFHTLVVDGPIFKKEIQIIKSETILKEGFWKHWFLDIKKYTTHNKLVQAREGNPGEIPGAAPQR